MSLDALLAIRLVLLTEHAPCIFALDIGLQLSLFRFAAAGLAIFLL